MTATTVTQAVATREADAVSLMWGRRTRFAAVLPDSIDVKSFLGTAAGALYADEDLLAAATAYPDSLIVTLMRCASLGHRPGTDEFYLHIRKGKVAGTEGYRGVIERMYRSGAVRKVVVREVCANDRFRYTEGVDDKPVHEIGGRGTTGADFFGKDGSRNRGAMVGVYAYAELTTGAVSRVVVMDRDDVMAARESSDAKDSKYSPWNRLDGGKDHPELTGRSMWWKTAAKRLEPWVPTSAEYRREQLRAAAVASDLAAVRGNGGAPPAPAAAAVPDTEIADAEIVDEPQDSPGPASAQAAGHETGAGPGPAAPAAGSAQSTASPAARPAQSPAPAGGTERPTPAALARLGRALTKVALGTPEDRAIFLAWVTGRPGGDRLEVLTRDETARITKALDDMLAECDGDGTEAAHRLWTIYRRDHPQDAAESSQDASEAGK